MDYYHCTRESEINDLKAEFTSDDSIGGKTIEFKLVLNVDIYNWSQYPDSPAMDFEGRIPTSTHTKVEVGATRKSLKHSHVREVVHHTFDVCEYYVGNRHRRGVIDRAWKEVSKIFKADKTLTHACGLVKLDCAMTIYHDHVYYDTPTDYPRLVPATDSSLGMLEEYEVDGDGCCVCLEEMAGGGCLRMSCTHVFHGDCIKEWLRTSRCCPLCRYEIPIAIAVRFVVI